MAYRSADDGCAQVSHQCAALGTLQVLLSGKVWLQEHKQWRSCPALGELTTADCADCMMGLVGIQEPSTELAAACSSC